MWLDSDGKDIKKVKGKIIKVSCDVMNYEDLKQKLYESQSDWSDAISKLHAFETLHKLEKKENERLHKELKEFRGF